MEYYSAIKGMEFVETWMELETVICSEESQKEKNKYCILFHIHRILKKWHRCFYLKISNRNTNVENNHMDIKVGRRGGMNWEIKINIYINTLLMLCIK